MIIRILGEGQYNLPGAHLDALNEIDNHLVEAVEVEDREKFAQFLNQMDHGCHISHLRHAHDLVFTRGQQGCRQRWKDSVFRSADVNMTVKGLPPLYDDFIQGSSFEPKGLGRGRCSLS